MTLQDLFDCGALEDCQINEGVELIINKLVEFSLVESRNSYIDLYEQIKKRPSNPLNVFVVDDVEEDAWELLLRINALDLIIKGYKSNHWAYDPSNIER
tara:strand:- start:314 stop:610 length:297 start_codon:yes stop_codon:yes gene_type:complete